MAALARHGVFKTATALDFTRKTVGSIAVSSRCGYVTKQEKKKLSCWDKKVPLKIDSTAESLAAKGFLRPAKEYQPPQDVKTRLENIFKTCIGSAEAKKEITACEKFSLLLACRKEFDHSVPNSLLHTIRTLRDLNEFYCTPVNTTTPYDKLKTMELPRNLHVQYEYHRFHPETDTMFGGVTAFPKSSTLVIGLKYKDKYKGHYQATQWPYK